MYVLTGAKRGDKARRMIDDLASHGIEAGFLHGPKGFFTPWTRIYALDNDCFSNSHKPGWWASEGERLWIEMLDAVAVLENKPLFCLLPDVVGDWPATVALGWRYIDEVRCRGLPVAIALQDGCCLEAAAMFSPDWFFVGGSMGWKLKNIRRIVEFASASFGIKVHAGRINGTKKTKWCLDAGVDSCDGTGLARFTDTMIPYTIEAFAAEHQLGLFEDGVFL